MGKSSDELRAEIDHDRQSAGQKIDQLEQQVQQNAEHMKQQAQDTAEQVRGEAEAFVHDTVDTVRQNMENFDFDKHIQERPLVMAGAALIGGFLLGGILGGDDNQRTSYNSGGTTGGGQSYSGGSGGGMASNIRDAAKKSGLEDTISNAAAALMGSLTEQLKGTLDQKMPGYADKMDTAQQQSGSFTDKAKATQQEAQQQR